MQARFGAIRSEPEDFFPVAEFRQQAGLLLGCYDQLNENPRLYLDIAKAIDKRLPVFGLVHSEEQAKRGMGLLLENGLEADAMHFVAMPANTIWIRDYAPFMIRSANNAIGMIDAKYATRATQEIRKRDEEMSSGLAAILGLPIRSIPLVLEGGNFLGNGQYTVCEEQEAAPSRGSNSEATGFTGGSLTAFATKASFTRTPSREAISSA